MPGQHPGVQTHFLEPGPTQHPPREQLSQAGECQQCPRAPLVPGQGTPPVCQGSAGPSWVSPVPAEQRPPPALLGWGSRSQHPSVPMWGHQVGPETPQLPLGGAPVSLQPLQRGQQQLWGGQEGAAIAGRWQGPQQLTHSQLWGWPQSPSVGSGALLCPLAAPGHQLHSLLASVWHHLLLLCGAHPEQGDARSQGWGHPRAGRAGLRQQAPFCQAMAWGTM